MKKEIWQDIKGYEGYYQISNKGRLKVLGAYIKKNYISPRNYSSNTIDNYAW